jgi:hypothetical protein
MRGGGVKIDASPAAGSGGGFAYMDISLRLRERLGEAKGEEAEDVSVDELSVEDGGDNSGDASLLLRRCRGDGTRSLMRCGEDDDAERRFGEAAVKRGDAERGEEGRV